MKKKNFLIAVLVCITMMTVVALPTFAGSKSAVSADASYQQVKNVSRTEITSYNTVVVKQATFAIVCTEQELSAQQKTQKVNELVAANASQHLGLNKVSKEDYRDVTLSRMTKLTDDERIKEIAQMLSGSDITPAAIENAKSLLRI